MGNSRVPGPTRSPPGAGLAAARTPGPLGVADQGDPTLTTHLGDTPGPLGSRDHGDPTLPRVAAASAPAGSVGLAGKGTPIAVGGKKPAAAAPTINGTIIEGGPLSASTQDAVNAAGAKTPSQWRRYIAYKDVVNVGGSLAWRANNPGNLRGASTKIGTVSGAVGTFAVFATLADGRAAQKALYLDKYGDSTVKAAINKLTPPNENDTTKYLADLKKAGVDLDKTVKSQIDVLMPAVEANEGLIAGTVVPRTP
jgi:hypothetical protein